MKGDFKRKTETIEFDLNLRKKVETGLWKILTSEIRAPLEKKFLDFDSKIKFYFSGKMILFQESFYEKEGK